MDLLPDAKDADDKPLTFEQKSELIVKLRSKLPRPNNFGDLN